MRRWGSVRFARRAGLGVMHVEGLWEADYQGYISALAHNVEGGRPWVAFPLLVVESAVSGEGVRLLKLGLENRTAM